MKRTYTGTTFYPTNLNEATVELFVYETDKYSIKSRDEGIRVTYTGVTSWDIVEGGEDAEEIERDTDGSCIDENHEYLVLHFEDGETSTFRNSHVSMFIW